MLGWEFPPQFSGGLGIATYGMVKALSPTTSIRLIIPVSNGESALANVSVTGLNKISLNESWSDRFTTDELANLDLRKINIALSPYHHINIQLSLSETEPLNFDPVKHNRVQEYVHRIFNDNQVYGDHVMEKIALYSILAEELAEDGDFDVIHAHDWLTYAAGMNIKARTGKPLLLHVHALETDRAGENTRNEIYELEKKAFHQADKIIAVSEYTRGQISSLYDVEAARIEVIHNGIDTPTSVPARKQNVLKDKLVVFLGRLTHQKGPQFLIETAEKVIRVEPRVKFIVAGAGDQFQHVVETVAYRKLGRHFIFTGFLTKTRVDELLAMADVYFMPSISEPFGLTALEAAQHEVPSIVSRQSGAHEVLPSGLSADFWDTDKYANYIFALLRYSALRQTMIEKAKVDLKTLTWDHAALKISRLYNMFSN
jgi:glycosyltransferase involved in cell wall biosynthesis